MIFLFIISLAILDHMIENFEVFLISFVAAAKRICMFICLTPGIWLPECESQLVNSCTRIFYCGVQEAFYFLWHAIYSGIYSLELFCLYYHYLHKNMQLMLYNLMYFFCVL